MCVKYVCRGCEARDDVERLGDGEVRGVRAMAQRVEHQHVEARRAAATTRRECALQSVRYAKRPKRKPRIGRGAVQDRHRRDRAAPPTANGPSIVCSVDLRHAAALLIGRIEDVAEHAAQVGRGARVGVGRESRRAAAC